MWEALYPIAVIVIAMALTALRAWSTELNKPILRTMFGSHIYGTNVPTSDLDFKQIFVPDAKDLVLQRAAKHIQNNTKKDESQKNQPGDVDDESFSVQHFLKLLCEGQTVALDMIFTPQEWWNTWTRDWQLLRSHRASFLHKGTSAFVGYTKQQAAKYGVKGFRVAALKTVLDKLSEFSDYHKLSDWDGYLRIFVEMAHNEHIKIVTIKGPNGIPTDHLEVCNRKIPFHASVKYAKEVLQRIYDEYGHRARLAEQNEGVDWKALMHAVRVAREAEELLLTGFITFPRPEAALLLQIRKAELPYKQVAEIIEHGLKCIEDAKNKSCLPERPDHKLAEDLVFELHREALRGPVFFLL
jgi:hypothetical protein